MTEAACEQPRTVCGFQMEAVHEDLMAGVLHDLADGGYRVHAYVNGRVKASRGDFLSIVSHPEVDVGFPPIEVRGDWVRLAEEARSLSPRLVYFNTLQRKGVAAYAARFGVPVLGVVHNPALFRDAPLCRELACSGRLDLLGLAPHVVATLEREVPEMRGRVHLHRPYRWMKDGDDRYAPDADRLDIVLPGAVDYRNRAFGPLVEHLASVDHGYVRPFRFALVAGGPDRERLEREVSEAGLDHFFDFLALDPVTRRVPHEAYLRRLYACDAIMTLLPNARPDYLRTKISTGVAAGIGTGRPIIAPRSVGEAYGFEPVEVPEDGPFDLTGADLSPARLARARANSLAAREEGLAGNRATMRAILASLDAG